MAEIATTSIAEHMRKIDPSYGSQAHQRDFLARLARADAANLCSRDHSAGTPPTHTTYRYPVGAGGRMVIS